MDTRHTLITLAAGLALAAASAVDAREPGFTYIEGGFFAGFVNDVGQAGRFTQGGNTLELETDAGGGQQRQRLLEDAALGQGEGDRALAHDALRLSMSAPTARSLASMRS